MVVGWSVSQRVLSDLHDIISVWIVYRARMEEIEQDQEDDSGKVREERLLIILFVGRIAYKTTDTES